MVIGWRQRIVPLEGDIALSENGITLKKVRTWWIPDLGHPHTEYKT